MTRLIVSIVLFIILAVFTVMNAQYSSPLNIFGYKVESVPIVATVVMAMAVGILYSFALYLTNYLTKRQAKRIKTEKSKNKQKAEELTKREKGLDVPPDVDEQQQSLPDIPFEAEAFDTPAEPKPAKRGRRKKK